MADESLAIAVESAARETWAGRRALDPRYHPTDASHIPVPVIADTIARHRNQKGFERTEPEKDALDFYLLNHLTSMLMARYPRYETLPALEQSALSQYNHSLRTGGERAFYYMLLICTREVRHSKGDLSGVRSACLDAKVSKKDTNTFTNFWYSYLKNTDSKVAVSNFTDYPPIMNLGAYAQCLEAVFFDTTFNGGYGGAAWGNIAKVLRQFITGETSLETLMDTVFTLAHNNGPIFNKQMFYHQQTDRLLKLLDLQRAGAVPSAILSGYYHLKKYVTPAQTDLLSLWTKEYDIPDKIDWHQVVALGAVGKYEDELSMSLPKASTPITKVFSPPKGYILTTKPITHFKHHPSDKADFSPVLILERIV